MKTSKQSLLLRLLLVVGLAALMLILFTAVASAATDIEAGSYWLYNLDRPYENTVYEPLKEPKPYLYNGKIEITAANLYVYNANGTHATYASGDYTPTLKDNVYGVKVAVVGRPADGYQWPDGDPSKIKLVWHGTTYAGGGNVVAVGEKKGTTQYAVFLFDAWVRGNVDTIDLSVPVPAAGNIPDNTLTFNAADDHGYSVQYVTWKVNNGSWGDGPAVWQGGDKVWVSVKLNKHSGCTFEDNLKIRLNGTQLSAGTEGDAYYYKSSTYYILYYAFNLADSLSTELDLSAGPVTVTNPDYKFGLVERYLNTLLTLANMPVPATYEDANHELDLNNDGKIDLTLAYKPRIPSGSNIRKSSIVITQGPGLYLAFGKKTEKNYSLTMSQQAELAGNNKVFWQKIKMTISRPKVTIDPNGGAFKNGSTSPAVFTVNASNYITTSAAAEYFDTSDSEKYGMKRDGYYVVGLAKTKDATSSSYTPNSSFFGSTTFTEDTTFYVVWKAYAKLTVDPNGGVFGDGTTVPFTVTLGKDGRVAKSAYLTQQLYNGNGPTREGYHLLGFNTLKNASTATSLDTLTSRTFSSDTTIYLIWHKKHFLTIDPNGGVFPDGSTTPVTLALDKNDRVSNADVMEYCLANTPVFRDGYRLSGFSEVKDGEFKYNSTGLRNTPFSEDKTVYALWTKTVTLTLDPNGGRMQMEMSPALTDKPYSFKIEVGRNPDLSAMIHYGAFIRDGFEITGFATDAGGVNKINLETWTVPDQDTTLYAVWSASNTLKITLQPYVIKYAPDGFGLLYGMDATFCCVAAGQDVRYQWQSAEAGSHDETKFTGLTWKDLAGETDYMLTVTASIEDHNGRVYRCIVKNKDGTTLESKIVFAEPTTLRRNPEDFVGEVGETAVFRAELSSPAPTYYWHAKKSGVELSLASIPGLTGQDTKELRFPITSDLNEVEFYCVVTDGKLGINESTESGKLFVKPSIKNVAVTVPTPSVGTKPSDIPITVSDGVVVEEAHWFRVYDPDEIDALREYGLAKLFNEGEPWRYHCYDMTGKDAPLVAGTYIVSVYFLKDVGGMDPFIAMLTGAYDAFNPASLTVTVNGVKCRRDYEMAASRANAAAYAVVTVYPPHAHKTEKINEVAATCVKPGTKSYYRCTVCGKLFSDDAAAKEITAPEAVPATGNHRWDLGEITKQPTTETPGLKTFTCLDCGATKTENIPVLPPVDPPEPPEPEILLGDVDNDGVISASDARLALRAAVGLELYAADSRAFKAADVNLDSVITSADARLILRKAVGFNDAEFGLKS